MPKSRIAVIGAGISGLSSAKILQDKGYEVVVFEKEAQAGGLIRCTVEEGNLFHRVGGHVFNTKVKKVADWFWKHVDKEEEFIHSKRNAKVMMNETLIEYPFENSLYRLKPEVLAKVIDELLILNKREQGQEFDNFEEFLRGNFGETLYKLYFGPYNQKIWNMDLKQVPLAWLDGKLPMPRIKEIILNNIIKADETEMVHSTFNYPKHNGSSHIANRLAEGLNIEFNTVIDKLRQTPTGWEINGQAFDSVVYTADIRILHKIIETPGESIGKVTSKVADLKSNGTSNALCYTDDSDLSWMYLPEAAIIPHRIIYTGNFSAHNNAGKRLTCTVEFSGQVEEETMRAELKKLKGNLEPIAFNWQANSYVIQEKDTRFKVQEVKDVLAKSNFYLCGRFAEWEYYNMDKAIEASMNLVEENF